MKMGKYQFYFYYVVYEYVLKKSLKNIFGGGGEEVMLKILDGFVSYIDKGVKNFVVSWCLFVVIIVVKILLID